MFPLRVVNSSAECVRLSGHVRRPIAAGAFRAMNTPAAHHSGGEVLRPQHRVEFVSHGGESRSSRRRERRSDAIARELESGGAAGTRAAAAGSVGGSRRESLSYEPLSHGFAVPVARMRSIPEEGSGSGQGREYARSRESVRPQRYASTIGRSRRNTARRTGAPRSADSAGSRDHTGTPVQALTPHCQRSSRGRWTLPRHGFPALTRRATRPRLTRQWTTGSGRSLPAAIGTIL
jgi:hypothetical protein